MLVKSADDKTSALEELQSLLERPDLTAYQRKAITKELYMMRSGIKGEKEAAYELDFHFKNSKNYVLLHDLRLEINDRVAQIDHVLIDRCLCVYIFETKNFSSGIKINEHGEFLSWNSYQKTYEGIPSPIAQNQRHGSVLNDFFETKEMPIRLGFKLIPDIIPFILISNTARIDRPEKFDTSSVIKCDALLNTLDKSTKNISAIKFLGSVSRIVSRETIEKVGRLLKHSHKPIEINYPAKFGLSELSTTKIKTKPPQIERKHAAAAQTPAPAPAPAPAHTIVNCSKCDSDSTKILSGRYGYYFKCEDCDGNTAIKLKCVTKDCKPRIRKQKEQFFEDCETCNSSRLYYENREVV